VPTETVTKVVDASAIVALILAEEGAETIAADLTGARLVAPAILAFELTNASLTQIRRRPLERERLILLFRRLGGFAIETQPVDQVGVLELAESTGLTAYDASYLWLARELSAELVTLDGQLAKAAVLAP
jgi:predicted nucleic acid-binding protein